MPNKFKVAFNGVDIELEREEEDILIEGYRFRPEIIYNGKFYRVFIDGKEMKVEIKDNQIYLDGKEVDFNFQHSPTLVAKKSFEGKKRADIKTAIPGKIVDVKVVVGEKVTDQQCLLVLESMKMRNEILSPINGMVDKILINTGDQVVSKQLLMIIKSIEKTGEE